jgi:hypothetical protein
MFKRGHEASGDDDDNNNNNNNNNNNMKNYEIHKLIICIENKEELPPQQE